MATEGSSQLSNVKRSFEKWFATNLGGTYAIDYDGVPFDSINKSEYLQPRLLVGGRQFHRHVDSSSNAYRGNTVSIIANINIFVRKGINQPADRLQKIRDAIFEKMREATSIVVYDFTGGGIEVAVMKSREVITDRELISSDPEAPRQWNFSVVYTYLEKY